MALEAVIFDMDGLLINSEPFWQESEKIIFGNLGIPLTTEMCMQTMGWKINEVIAHWYRHKPWPDKTHKEVEDEIVAEVSRLIRAQGQAMQGVHDILDFFRTKGLKIGLASSSPQKLIECVVDQLGIRAMFDTIHSAEKEAFGKPHPAVYLSAAQMLGVPAERSLAFEDSYNGLLAAKRAGMLTVAVPEGPYYDSDKFDIADLKLRSLADFDETQWERLNTLANR